MEPSSFDMRFYKSECGTIGCALGWLPLALELDKNPLKDEEYSGFLNPMGQFDYSLFGYYALGLHISTDEWADIFGQKNAFSLEITGHNRLLRGEHQKSLFLTRLNKYIEKREGKHE